MNARALIAASALMVVGACQAGPDAGQIGSDGATLSVSVAPLTLKGVTNACYDIFVHNGGGALVWSKTDICADSYGDDGGSISYVGPCDASVGVSTNTVTLELTSISDITGPILATEYANPCPAGEDRCRQPALCQENSDKPVTFNLVVMRNAVQGFFDIAVNFEDIFCSAKFDCEYEVGRPIELLHYPPGHAHAGDRGPTAVLGFACASGTTAAGGAAPTTLYMDHVVVDCGADGVFAVDPTSPPGNAGGAGDILFQTAIYRGLEDFTAFKKGYWNVALGFDAEYMETNGVSCTVRTRATAHEGPFPDPPNTPIDTVYPVVGWHDILIGVADDGTLDCGQHPLDQPGSSVFTEYTTPGGTSLLNEYSLDPEGVSTPGSVSCGDVGGVGAATVTDTGAGFVVKVGDIESSPIVVPPGIFPAGTGLGSCCVGDVCLPAGG